MHLFWPCVKSIPADDGAAHSGGYFGQWETQSASSDTLLISYPSLQQVGHP
jgi:hypothetical protein